MKIQIAPLSADFVAEIAGVDLTKPVPDAVFAAIEAAFERARPGDIVLLAGKGHEQTILYADHALPWDEARVARDALREMGWTGD
jgi:UDP-N-acetylmuramoyl-L-alanyl-D-glutamate--2,6-diaminopimelate ligase